MSMLMFKLVGRPFIINSNQLQYLIFYKKQFKNRSRHLRSVFQLRNVSHFLRFYRELLIRDLRQRPSMRFDEGLLGRDQGGIVRQH